MQTITHEDVRSSGNVPNMAGWFLDVFVELIFRIVVRAFRTIGTRTWPMVEAKVIRADPGEKIVYGCHVAEITYTYVFEGQRYRGTNKKPFIQFGSAQDYADQFKQGNTIFVRVNPAKPERSVVLNWDQVNVPAALEKEQH